MPLDTNIALGIRPVEQPNMLAQMGQMMQLRQMQQEYQDTNAMRDLAAQHGGDISNPNFLKAASALSPKFGADLSGKVAANQKTNLEIANTRAQALSGGFAWLSENPSLDNATNLVASWQSQGLIPPDVAKHYLTTFSADPSKIAFNANLGAKSAIDAGKQATLKETARGHDLVHSVGMANVGLSRERLTAEQTPLAIDDKTIDLVANRYLIDGTLPPLGMGKPAAMLRAKILDRAQAIATAPPAATPPPPNAAPSVSVGPQTEIAPPTATGAAPVVNNLNPAPTAAAPIVNNLVAPAPAGTPPVVAPVGTTPQQAAQNIVTSKVNTATQKRALTDFSTGIQGRMVNSMNTAVEHLSTLTELADALKNNDVRAINTVGNLVAKQTGSPAPTNFAAARQIVAQEIVKAIVANGGTGREREEAAANIAAAGSPEQLAGVISTYQELLAGQLKSLGLQYKNTTGRDDFNTKLLPSTLKALSRVEAGTPAKTGDITSDAGIAKVIKSDAEFNALPSGTIFIAPDGSTRRKP